MDIELDNATILEKETTLDHNETWEMPVSYVLDDPGDDQKLEFLLYRDGNFTAPYRDLHLWVNVTTSSSQSEEDLAQRFRLV